MKHDYRRAKYFYHKNLYRASKLLISQDNTTKQPNYQLVGVAGNVASIIDLQTNKVVPVRMGETIPGSSFKVVDDNGTMSILVDNRTIPLSKYQANSKGPSNPEWESLEGEAKQLIAVLQKLDKDLAKHMPALRYVMHQMQLPESQQAEDAADVAQDVIVKQDKTDQLNLQRKTILDKLSKAVQKHPQLSLESLGLSYDLQEGLRQVDELAKLSEVMKDSF